LRCQGNSKLAIPEQFVYLDAANTRKFLELQHNLSDGRAVNFSAKILGRRGFTTVIMVTDPENLRAAESSLDNILTGYTFNAGETYADWRSGDKVAEYGLAALIVGGVAAVAAKKGLFSVLAGFLAASWKFIMIGVVAAATWVRNLFARKRNG
jgi:uncharacterized membrane-anchored protein